MCMIVVYGRNLFEASFVYDIIKCGLALNHLTIVSIQWAFFLSLLNLPCHIHYSQENTNICDLILGSSEPSHTIIFFWNLW